MLMVAADVGGGQPHHVGTEITVRTWPECKMKMVGHQTISQQPHRHALAGFAEEFSESSKVAIFAKDATTPIATVHDVVTIAAQSISCTARHNHDYDIGLRRPRQNALVESGQSEPPTDRE